MELEALRLAEEFFACRDTEVLAIVRPLLSGALERWPEASIITQKSQVGFHDPRPFCALYPPRAAKDRKAHALGLSLFLSRPIPSARIAMTVEPYPGRWTNHMVLPTPDAVDDELWQWLEEARQFRCGGRP